MIETHRGGTVGENINLSFCMICFFLEKNKYEKKSY